MCECAAFADRDISNPVEVDLMGEVIVGDGAGQVWGKGICQAASDQADILVAINREPHARRRGSDVHGLRKGIVEVKLQSVAELLPQARLQGVVVRTTD